MKLCFRQVSVGAYVIGSSILLALGSYNSGIITPIGKPFNVANVAIPFYDET